MRTAYILCLLLLMTASLRAQTNDDTAPPALTPASAAAVTLLAELPLPGANSAAWSAADRLAVGTFGGAVDIYDMREPRAMLVPLLSFTVSGRPDELESGDSRYAVLNLKFSRDGSLLAVAHMNGLEIWNLTSRNRQVLLEGVGIGGAAFSPDGTALAVFTLAGEVSIWSMVNGGRLLALPEIIDRPTGIGFSPDGELLAVGEREGHIYLFPISRGGEGRWLRHAELPAGMTYGDSGGGAFPAWGRDSVSFSPNSQFITSSDHLLYTRLWSLDDAAVRTALVRIDESGRAIGLTSGSAAFTSNGELLITASGGAGSRTRGVYLWDVIGSLNEEGAPNLYGEPTAANWLQYLPHRGADSLALAPTGTRLASAGGDRVRLWGLSDERAPAETLAGLSDLNYIAYCIQLGQTPLRPRPDQRVGVVWSWYAVTPEQLNDHIEHAEYNIRLDDAPLLRWRFLTPPAREAVNNNNWTVYYYTPAGRLESGAHRISYEVTWAQPISDGIADYGPGTPTQAEVGECEIEVANQ